MHTTQFAIRKPEIGLFEKVLQVSIDEMRKYGAETGRPVLAVAGVCGETPQALNEAKTAKRLGYDIALLSPGGLGHLSEAEMVLRTRAVAEVMDVMGFYLQVAVGGRAFSYDYWRQICAIGGACIARSEKESRSWSSICPAKARFCPPNWAARICISAGAPCTS